MSVKKVLGILGIVFIVFLLTLSYVVSVIHRLDIFAQEISITVLPGNVNDSGLEAYYKFDDAYEVEQDVGDDKVKRAMAKDSSPNQRDLYFQHNSNDHSLSVDRWVEGRNGGLDKAFYFDGQGAFRAQKLGEGNDANTDAGQKYYITTKENDEDLDFSFTISFWLNVAGPVQSDNGYNIIIDTCETYGSDKSSKATVLSTLQTNDGGITSLRNGFTAGDGNWRNDKNYDISYTDEDLINQWNLFTIVVTDNVEKKEMVVYENGEVKKTEVLEGNSFAKGHYFGSPKAPWSIGGLIAKTTGVDDQVKRGLNGTLDELMIFSRALSEDEVVALKNGYANPVEKYTVTFNSNGGSTVDAITVDSGAKATKPIAPTKDGYKFVGWFKDENLTQEFDFETETVISNITLYAKWDKNVSGGCGNMVNGVDAGIAVIALISIGFCLVIKKSSKGKKYNR